MHAEAMAAYHCGYVKCHRIVPFKMVHFLLHEFHFSFFFFCLQKQQYKTEMNTKIVLLDLYQVKADSLTGNKRTK